jgi:hypothetical protein
MPIEREERWWSDETEELMERLGIADEDKDWFANRLTELGYKAYSQGDTKALLELRDLFAQAGFEEKALELTQDYMESEDFYSALLNYTGYWDESVKRWRDMQTGQFMKDPYTYVLGAWTAELDKVWKMLYGK